MESLLKDIRYGYRTLLRNPGFTTVAVVSLALGIGANTAIFSFIDTVLLKSLPVRDPEQLVLFGEGKSRGNSNGLPGSGPAELFSWSEYQEFRKANQVFGDILAVDSNSNWSYAKFDGSISEGLQTTLVSRNFFNVLGAQPVLGRFFDSSADRVMVAIGVLIGIPLSIGAGRVMQSFLFEMSPFDMRSTAAGVGMLAIVAGLAGYLPARRASDVDPMVALRHE